MKNVRFGKKQAITLVMVLLLGAAVYLNYYVTTSSPLTVGGDAQTPVTDATQPTKALGESQFVGGTTAAPLDYFEEARRSREEARTEALAIVQDTLQEAKLDAATRQQTLEAAAVVAQAVEQEDAVESLIKAKGFADCVVYIDNGTCHAVVKATTLTDAQALQISEIIASHAGVEPSKIHITAAE